jgi:2-polyprenyl-3-methyl-5-hydroxy-6-metoxy-1,4-benzoquinol methylase
MSTTQNNLRSVGYVDRTTFIVEEARGKRVLDCGVVALTCSDAGDRVENMPNTLHVRLKEVARELVGIDHAADVVAAINARLPELNLRSCDVEDLGDSLSTEPPFELVVFGDILEHLSNPGRALDGARSMLAPDGEILVTCPNAFGLPNYLRFLTGRYHEGADHVAAHSKLTLAHLLRRHGFIVDRVYTALDRMPRAVVRRGLYRVGSLVFKAFPELGGTLVIVARRAGSFVA